MSTPQDRIRLKTKPVNVAVPQGAVDLYVDTDGSIVKESPDGTKTPIGGTGTATVDNESVNEAISEDPAASRAASNSAPRWASTAGQRNISAAVQTATPKFVVFAGDSLSTSLRLPAQWMKAGEFGTGTYGTAGTAPVTTTSDDWITGIYRTLAVGSTVQFHPQGGVDAAFRMAKFAVGYMADSGAGGFDVEMSSTQVSSGAWTKVGSTQNTENATLIGKYTVFDVPSTSNAPRYKVRITNITGKAVKLVVWGYYTHNQGGVVSVMGLANLSGRNVSQWTACPDAVFTPIWTGISPDLVVSRWADAGTGWADGGAFDVQYDRIKAVKPTCDFVQIGMGPTYDGPDSGAVWPAYYSGQSTYRVGDIAVAQNDSTKVYGRYVCTQAHTQSADKKPGQGASWASYWTAYVYDSGILSSGEAAVSAQIEAQAAWAERNSETFIDTTPVFGTDYLQSFQNGLTADFVHPTTAGWEATNLHVESVLPLARSVALSGYSSSLGPIALAPSGAGNVVELNRGLRLSAGANTALYLDATDAGTDSSKFLAISQTADVASLSVSGTPLLYLVKHFAGQHSIRPQGTSYTLGDSTTAWGALYLDKTITAAGTTGAQTINKAAGRVNFAAGATSLVVTDSRVTANSIIVPTVATNDATMSAVKAVPAAGSFTLYANAAPTAETAVSFFVIP